jgi:hypothetical protein
VLRKNIELFNKFDRHFKLQLKYEEFKWAASTELGSIATVILRTYLQNPLSRIKLLKL